MLSFEQIPAYITVTIAIVVFGGIGVSLLKAGIQGLFLPIWAMTWPTTWGTVESCTIVEKPYDGSIFYHVEAKYSYTVDSTHLQGERIGFGAIVKTTKRATHEKIARRFFSGQRVLVRYNPSNISQAVLLAMPMPGSFVLIVFGVISASVSVVMGLAAFNFLMGFFR